ncbi:MAG: ribosomal-processing cysteine protease Prp [Clostridia bacterium]|nr:ribosomal-processing cysteine protease Prp [Clostridia bacterium]
MIHITVSPKKLQLRIKGHADYAEPGKDIICASVSYAFYNLCQVMTDYTELGLLCKAPKMKDCSGNSFIEVIPKKEYEKNVQIVFSVIARGLEVLATNYPEFVDFRLLEY